MAELKTFLFTDICGSVRLKNEMTGRSVTERDLAFIQTVLTPHRQRIEAQLQDMGGRVVSTAGDGHFLVFDNTIQAAQWAVDVQIDHRDNPIKLPGGERVEVRMSIHVGVPQIDPNDPDNFVGKSVDYAARLNDYATGGQILVSRSVMAILEDVGLEGISIHLHGRRELKGIGRVEVHELLYEDHGPRRMRNEPKSHSHRQWTVIPSMGFEGDETTENQGAVIANNAIKKVGNYVLEGQLGAGGMGDVYKARHSQFDRIRAVKVIKPQFVGNGHTEVVNRFYNEIKAVGKLEHRNIVVAIDSSEPSDKIHYLVMEYIDGVGLDELVARHGPLSTADACEIISQAARGLEYIHRHGMVHRDVKPSNLMLTLVENDASLNGSLSTPASQQEQGVVKILDLGLALLADHADDRLTRYDNRAMGTGMYMPPEQWKTTSVDIRADIYSLGCTLYHLLAGNPPFIDSDLRPEKAHEKQALPPIRNAVIPHKLWLVLRKMTAKRPADRYASPAEAAVALAPFVEGSNLPALIHEYRNSADVDSAQVPTHPDSLSQRDTWWSQVRTRPAVTLVPTRRWVLSTALPLLAMAVMLAGAIWMVNHNSDRAVNEAERLAKNNLPTVARNARDKLAGQIKDRFEILLKAAQDPLLIAQLQKINANPQETALREPLQDWVKDQFLSILEKTSAESMFIVSRNGTQVARAPEKDSIGKNYRYRDYFHGGGEDLDETAAQDAKPITDLNLSAVYKSTTSGKLKVAFSVPVWNQTSPGADREVIGVLALSTDLGAFEGLDRTLVGGNQVVLVDTRPDFLGKKRNEGLILEHPEYQQRADRNNPPRISGELLERMKAARTNQPNQFFAGYQDPLAQNPNQRFWGAYEPIEFELDPEEGKKRSTGWVVLVQDKEFQ